MAQMRVFVSHSHEDDTFCRGVVAALRDAGADVWYDEHNLGSGQLVDAIERELKARPVVVVILSNSALASSWVRDECKWAYSLLHRDPSRIILPVTATPLDEDAIWMFLSDFKRVETPDMQPYPLEEACGRLLHALALTATGGLPIVRTPQPDESVDELLAQGKALVAQDNYAEAIPFFETATTLDPRTVDAWANLGFAYDEVGRPEEGLVAYDRALALDSRRSWVWGNKGAVLTELKRFGEALPAYERALALDPNDTDSWYNRGTVLMDLRRYDEAVAAYERALVRDPSDAPAWRSKGAALTELRRYEEALEAYDRALALDPEQASGWSGKATALRGLGRVADAKQAERRAHRVQQTGSPAWPVVAWLREHTLASTTVQTAPSALPVLARSTHASRLQPQRVQPRVSRFGRSLKVAVITVLVVALVAGTIVTTSKFLFGTSTDTRIDIGGSIRWEALTGSGEPTTPAVVSGVAYFGKSDGFIYAFNTADGTLRWRFQTGGLVYSSPAVVSGLVYVGSDDDFVYALNATNGALRWRFQTGDAVYSSPAVVSGIVYVGSDDGYLYALTA
jgi:Flp pilus assembly protein TadD